MSVPLEDILNHPANKARIARRAADLLRQQAAEEAAALAEEIRLREQGTALDHAEEMRKCAADAVYWFNTHVWTYNPKLVGKRDPVTGEKLKAFVQFKLWPRQVEFIRWAEARLEGEEQGACKKSRDVGVTYLTAGLALHRWLFEPGFKATFGSRVMDYVDQKDNPDSIFAKLRIMLRLLPPWMMPEGFNWNKHDNLGRLVNPANDCVITGEGGQNMGRGGRSTLYVLDEAAFVENAEAVEAALSGNTDTVLWVSSANGMGNLFFRKTHGGLDPRQVFTLHYRDDPRKDAEWVKKKRAQMEAVAWASEYEIDFAASLEGVCIPAAYVRSCQELATLLRGRLNLGAQDTVAGLDVGAGGKGKSVFISRRGPVVRVPKSRGNPDTTGTAHWALGLAVEEGARQLYYDAPGVGVGVTSALNHVPTTEGQPGPVRPKLAVTGVNTGEGAPGNRRWPDKRTSAQKFQNLKAEIWWLCREAAKKSHELLMFLKGELLDPISGEETGAREWPLDECLLLPSGDPESELLAAQLSMVKTDKNTAGKIVMETKAALKKRGIPSPDYADSLVLTWVDKGAHYNVDALA